MGRGWQVEGVDWAQFSLVSHILLLHNVTTLASLPRRGAVWDWLGVCTVERKWQSGLFGHSDSASFLFESSFMRRI